MQASTNIGKASSVVLSPEKLDSLTFKTFAPLYEWEGSAEWSVASEFEETPWSGNLSKLFELEVLYHCGEFSKALELSTDIIEAAEDESAVMSALATRLLTAMAAGNADAAFSDLRILVRQCQEGLRRADEPIVYTTSLLCARRIETALLARFFDYPYIAEDGVDRLPGGVKALLGSLLAIREMQRGNMDKAEGVVYAFQRIIGVHYPASRLVLTLLSAGIDVVNGRVESAERGFKEAWGMAADTGLDMPFVELNNLLHGLPRRCFPKQHDAMYRHIESLSRVYYKGWCDVRRKCGINVLGETLTPIEWYVATLAVMGWRNKEIAAYLNISENTAKHRLTGFYQKTGVRNRAGISAFIAEAYAIPLVEL